MGLKEASQPKMSLVSVIGTASLDTLHLPHGETVEAAGGAGLYTALAAHKAGAKTTLFAPKPEPIPTILQPAADLLHWDGPLITPGQLSRLEIKHHGGGKATLLQASWGAETALTPDLLPSLGFISPFVHIAALSTAQRQLDFLAALKQHPSKISVGTYAYLVYNHTEQVRCLFEAADIFFMNENEANGLFGRLAQAYTKADALLFITRAADGAVVIEGHQKTIIAGHPAVEIDPTGAGDTFCGATLAALALGLSPVAAAKEAVKLAAKAVEAVGA